MRFPDNVSEAALLEKIHALNEDADVDGYIVQLPLPAHISADKINEHISRKRYERISPAKPGRACLRLPTYQAATPFGIMKLLEAYQVETSGKHGEVSAGAIL